jgi:hypothetical protein
MDKKKSLKFYLFIIRYRYIYIYVTGFYRALRYLPGRAMPFGVPGGVVKHDLESRVMLTRAHVTSGRVKKNRASDRTTGCALHANLYLQTATSSVQWACSGLRHDEKEEGVSSVSASAMRS